jgi:hypothetical protein
VLRAISDLGSLPGFMVNARFPPWRKTASCAARPHDSSANTGIRSVNESFSKPLEFSKNSPRIRFECAQKPERALQACLLLVCHAAN